MHSRFDKLLEAAKHVPVFSITTNATILRKHNLYGFLLNSYYNIELVVSYDDVHGVELPLEYLRRGKFKKVLQGMYTHGFDSEKFFEMAEYLHVQRASIIYPIGFYGNVETLPEIKITRKWPFEISIPPKQPTRKKCYDPFYFMRIAMNGNVYPCCYIYNSTGEWCEEWQGVKLYPPQSYYKMGNILTDELKDIWYSHRYKLLRDKIYQANKINGSCSTERLNDMRVNNPCSSFSYCNVCLRQWGCAC
jgi:hypothetical protein